MNRDLVSALELLKAGRAELAESYVEEDSERYFYSFQYMHSQVALSLASMLLEHQWIDSQIQRSLTLVREGELSAQAQNYVLGSLQRLSIFEAERLPFEGYQPMLSSKIASIRSFLEAKDRIDERGRSLAFDYHRDKVLFEREMQKYSK